MKIEIPAPIKEHLLQLRIALFAFLAIGLLFGIVSKDKVILMLTGLIAVYGAAKLKHMRTLAEHGEFDVASGVVLSDQRLHRKHKLVLLSDDGAEIVLLLSGRPSYSAGSSIKLYLTKLDNGMRDLSLPEQLKPTQNVLGIKKGA